jgi:hypothetical protein
VSRCRHFLDSAARAAIFFSFITLSFSIIIAIIDILIFADTPAMMPLFHYFHFHFHYADSFHYIFSPHSFRFSAPFIPAFRLFDISPLMISPQPPTLFSRPPRCQPFSFAFQLHFADFIRHYYFAIELSDAPRRRHCADAFS